MSQDTNALPLSTLTLAIVPRFSVHHKSLSEPVSVIVVVFRGPPHYFG